MYEEELSSIRDTQDYILGEISSLRGDYGDMLANVVETSGTTGYVLELADTVSAEMNDLRNSLMQGIPAILYEALDKASVQIDEVEFEEQLHKLLFG